ncbi:hypothetical protein ACNVED_07995 [Legionella sp. D16C41]|uniref:hypothetical protein n=1 Tax=Legionella sp. D16C41 TaxID=3402688 RepID=UPI003AF74888
MSYGKHLNKFSSLFFFMGFVAAKMQFFSFYLFSVAANIFSLTCYLIGYLFWLVASFLNQNTVEHDNSWYGLTSFTTQHKYAAALGIAATVCFFIAINTPFVAIPAVWLFAASNIFWCIAEFNKWKHPPEDKEYSSNRQTNYLQYSLLSTATSLVTALAVTFSMIFPLSGFAILTGASIISLIISIQTLNAWASVNLANDKPDYVLAESYLQMFKNLSNIKPENLPSANYEKINNEELTTKPLFTKVNYNNLSPISANEVDVNIENSTTCSL